MDLVKLTGFESPTLTLPGTGSDREQAAQLSSALLSGMWSAPNICVRSLDKNWRDESHCPWRSFVDLRATVEDTNISDRLEATDTLRQFCRHAFELRDWLPGAPELDLTPKTAIEQLFGKPSENPAKRVPAACRSRSRHGRPEPRCSVAVVDNGDIPT